MGFTCETVVSTVVGLTRLPIWMLAIPAMPSMSERTLVNPRLSWAVSTAASLDSMPAVEVFTCASACALVEYRYPTGFARCAGRRQRSIPFHVDLSEPKLSLRLRQLAACLGDLTFGLIENSLEGPRVDFEQDVVFVNERTFAVVCRIR